MPDVSELASYVQPLYLQFKANCLAAGLDTETIDIARTPAQQQQNIINGVSWTQNSKHLPQPPEGKSEAFDEAIKEYIPMKMWNPHGPKWAQMGSIGKKLGLLWGGDWPHHPDPSHFEYVHPPIVTDTEIGM